MRHTAIRNLYTNAVTIDDGAGIFDAQGKQVTIDEAAVAAEVARLQAEYDNNEYQRQRAAAYPSIPDQLDQIYHEGIDAWKATITAVKQEYPKP